MKPENIFLLPDGRVKILDFGLATLLDAAAEAPASQKASATVPRSLVAGTAGYMAPEQVRGDTVDQRADIFALGAVLYEMLAGRPPFKGDSTLAPLEACLTLEPRDLSDVNAEIPPSLTRLVGRCLAKRADDRFTTIAELATALDGVIRS
jgi:serine/threonine-protein kinase